MLDRRRTRPLLAGLAALAVLGPCLPAQADPSDPTPSELQAAHSQVTAAQQSFSNVQVQAEHAAELYNGALTRAHRAERIASQASARATAAEAVEAQAQGVATGARAVADAARRAANRALEQQRQAEADVIESQRALDRMAASAYTSGGQLGYLGRLAGTTDPAMLARGQAYVNRIGSYQQGVIIHLTASKTRATFASQSAAASSKTAASSAKVADAALAKASAASATAASARSKAASAAQDSHHALFLASKAKGHALYLVAKAERSLGNAKQRAHRLELAAAAAKRAARGVTSGKAPSDAAATAIHWAFQEIGVPYSWGGGDEDGPTYGFAQGAGTKGFDCSGLMLFAYAHAGIHLDHYSGSQYDQGKRISRRSDLKPGDLMFFAYDTSDPSTIHHVSMYLGNNRMIEAPYTGEVVRVSSADRGDFIGGSRPWA
jgi:cell wall-associated NlpC family hydrolase